MCQGFTHLKKKKLQYFVLSKLATSSIWVDPYFYTVLELTYVLTCMLLKRRGCLPISPCEFDTGNTKALDLTKGRILNSNHRR